MLIVEHYLLLDSWLMLSWIMFEDIKSMIKLAPQPTISNKHCVHNNESNHQFRVVNQSGTFHSGSNDKLCVFSYKKELCKKPLVTMVAINLLTTCLYFKEYCHNHHIGYKEPVKNE